VAERAHPDDPGFQGTVYEHRMHQRYRFAAQYVAGRDVLDVACGTAWGWKDLGSPRSVTGVDISEYALREGRRLGFLTQGLAADMERLPFRPASFEVITCLEAIEHIAPGSAITFLSECRRVLRPGGILVLSTPLRKDDRHSGNPWHSAEYCEDEIRSLLDASFECLESHVDLEADPPVFLYAGRLRDELPAAISVQWRDNHKQELAAAWLRSTATQGGFRFTPQGTATVTSTSIGLLLAEGLGAVPEAQPDIVELIRSAQDPSSGLFREPFAASVPLLGEEHDSEYHDCMTTYFALHALDVLGERPQHPLHFLESFRQPGAVAGWLESLNWANPWRESNRIMHLLSALLFALLWDRKEWAADRYHDVLDWLDAWQDPRTGLWGADRGASLLNAVAGAYHFVPFYRYARRPVRGWSKIIDACLKLQHDDGLFAPFPGGGACEDLDAIDLLCTGARAANQLTPEIRQALTRAFWAIWNMQREDGSMPYADEAGNAVYRFSSWPAMEAPRGGGDVWATWVRLASMHTIRALLGDDLPPLGPWIFRRLPALGFHLQEASIPPDAPPEHRPIWFRPLPAPPEPAAPRVSVVVTCYNLGQYLHETLSSVRNQTLQEVETVIIDDGSTDPYTIARLDALAEDGWRVVRTENRGLPAARNLGIRATRAPFVCCLDADDRLRPEYLEKAVSALDANPRAGFVTCFYELFDEGQGCCRHPRPRLPRMLARNEAVVSSVFRRDAWAAAGGYCEDLPAMQDWDFWITLLEKGWEGELLPEVLFDYRIRSGSMYSETRKPARYAKISSLIAARHRALFEKHLVEIHALKSRLFAEHVEFSLRQEESHRRAVRELQRQIARLQQPATAPESRPQHAPPIPSMAPPSLVVTAAWTLIHALHPRGRWRGLRNLWLLARVLSSSQLRELWYSYFDPFDYCRQRPDIVGARIHASVHFALAGAWEQAEASAEFSVSRYWARHPDVEQAGLNPLLHYLCYGRREGRIAIPARASARFEDFPEGVRREGSYVADPVVSVVIPCFNLGRYVEEAVFSALRQTLERTDIVVVEGGSTDGETRLRLQRLDKAALPSVRVLYRDKPALAGDNRNFGIRHARGRYICCLDADDLLDPSYLECALFALEFADADFSYPAVREFGAGSMLWLTPQPRWPDIVRENPVSTVALFRREIWERIGGFRDWGVGRDHVPEDWDFWIRGMAEGYTGISVREPLMHYRVRPGSLSRKDTGGTARVQRRIAALHSERARQVPPPRPFPAFGRLSWGSLEASPRPTVMLVIPFFTIGGAERIFVSLFREWRRRGVRVIVVTTLRLPPHVPNRIDQVRSFTPHAYQIAELFEGKEDLQASFLYFLIRRYKPELIFTAGSDFLYSYLPAIRRHFPEVRVIDQLFNDQVHLPTNRACATWIDCTSVPNQRFARRLVEEFGESPERVAVVRQCIRMPRPSNVRPPAGWPARFSGRPVIGFFGRVSAEKAPFDFLHIAKKIHSQFPEARFVMAGDGPDLEAVRAMIRKLGLEDVVHAAGFVPGVHDWMDACEFTILCSKIDGMPLAVLEAQALGKPVIASRVGSVPEMIVDGESGLLCEPGDLEAFASAALRLLRDEELRRRMGAAGREHIHSEFREEIMIEQYFRLFERITGKRQEGGETG